MMIRKSPETQQNESVRFHPIGLRSGLNGVTAESSGWPRPLLVSRHASYP